MYTNTKIVWRWKDAPFGTMQSSLYTSTMYTHLHVCFISAALINGLLNQTEIQFLLWLPSRMSTNETKGVHAKQTPMFHMNRANFWWIFLWNNGILLMQIMHFLHKTACKHITLEHAPFVEEHADFLNMHGLYLWNNIFVKRALLLSKHPPW